jgi:hypothetical protein
MPDLYFCSDLQGDGWCFRKQQYLNVGFGRLDPRSLPSVSPRARSDNDEPAPGPLMIQGDHGRLWIRKAVVRPITKAGK